MTINVSTSTITFPGGSTQSTANSGTLSGLYGQVFNYTGSAATFTIPPGVTKVKAIVVGGGGGGGSAAGGGTYAIYGGGGGAGAAIAYLTGLTPNNTITVTVGRGGQTYGSTGGDSTITSGTQTISTVTGGGGGGGAFAASSAGGTATGGTINIPGRPSSPPNNLGGSSAGGTSIFGGAGAPYNGNGGAPGAGGGGSNGNTAINTIGANGIVIFEW
jgi:hypothetical protein